MQNPVPPIAAGTLHGMRAKTAGTVVSTNLIRGTMLVQPGQTVEAGQVWIGIARTERNGTLIFEPAAGTVRARIVWKGEFWEEMHTETPQLTGNKSAHYQLLLPDTASLCRGLAQKRACGKSKTLAAGAAGSASAGFCRRDYLLCTRTCIHTAHRKTSFGTWAAV